jgi:polyisoprenoid-binding protein YceI
MKTRILRKTMNLLAVPLLLVLGGGAWAADAPVRYEGLPGSKITIDGTSTIHEWKVECLAVGGFIELDPAFDADLKTIQSQPKVEVVIPVRQLKSGKKAMDNVMYDALKQKDNPQIKYRLLELTPKAGGSAGQFDAKGELTISGVMRTNNMPVTFERVDKTKLKVHATTGLKMSDYGIQPPSPALVGALIKTGNDVTLSIEWLTGQPATKTAEKAP